MRYKDLAGLHLGRLTVLEPTEERIRGAVVWKCRCDCGNVITVESRRLKPGAIYSCGCGQPVDQPGKDLTGMRFGKLTVLGRSENKARDGNLLWRCRCDCGNVTETTRRRLLTGSVRSCGCGKRPPLKDLADRRFGMLTVVSYVGKDKGFHIWRCRCGCGKMTDVRQSNLLNGTTASCGCRRSPQKNLHYADGTCLELLKPDIMYKTNTSGVRGVYYSSKRKKWIAQIMFKKKCYYLGGYDRLEDAAEARAEAEEKVFGDFLKWYEEERAGEKAKM